MKSKKIFTLFIISSVFLSINIIFLTHNISAAGLIKDPTDLDIQGRNFADSAGFDTTDMGSAPIGNLMADIIGALLSLLGIIFLGLIIYAGYNWMTASGDEEKIKKSTDTIKRAIIGLIITLSAYAITYFVFNNFFTGNFQGGTQSGNVDTVNISD